MLRVTENFGKHNGDTAAYKDEQLVKDKANVESCASFGEALCK